MIWYKIAVKENNNHGNLAIYTERNYGEGKFEN